MQFPAIRALWKETPVEGMICIAVAVAVVTIDLLSGVMLGIGLSVVKLIHTFTRLGIRLENRSDTGRMVLVLEGSATFLRLPKLAAALERIPAGVPVYIDVRKLNYIDHACLTLLTSWEKRHQALSGSLELDWEGLRARFQDARPARGDNPLASHRVLERA